MAIAQKLELSPSPPRCDLCGIPLDSKWFDESGVVDAPGPGRDVVLARFSLHPQYCGILQYFAQFTDLHARDPSKIETPGLEWSIRSNGHPLYPYIKLDHIVNPWGLSTFPIAVRLDESATIELVVRAVGAAAAPGGINRVGGRLMGRYWYNALHGRGY